MILFNGYIRQERNGHATIATLSPLFADWLVKKVKEEIVSFKILKMLEQEHLQAVLINLKIY